MIHMEDSPKWRFPLEEAFGTPETLRMNLTPRVVRSRAFSRNMQASLTAVALLAGLVAASGQVGAPAQCAVDWNDVHQRIDGFGASSAWNGNWTTAEADLLFSTNNKVAYQSATYTGVGLSLLRNHITYANTTSASDLPTTVETGIMQMAQARGARVWSTPWTPAAGFKSTHDIYDQNKATDGGIDGGSYLGSGNNITNINYASQLANYVASMSHSYGVNLYAISVQNEPDANVTNYEACQWSGAQIHDFVPNLYSALAAKGVGSTKIIIPESQNWSSDTALYTPTLNDPDTAADVDIIANHDYVADNSVGDQTTPLAVSTSGKALWETEVALLSGSDSSITNGIYYAQRIYLYMTQAEANAYHYWWLVPFGSGNEGLLDTSAAPTKRLFTFGQYSRFVRPNFYRIGATSSQSSALISAYKDSASAAFAIVVVNTNAATDVIASFDLTNFTAASVTPWVTSSTLSLAQQPAVNVTNSSFTYTVPAMSVVTLTGMGAPPPPPPPPPPLAGYGNNDFGQSIAAANLSNSLAVAAGGYHSLALSPEGTITAWGDDEDGQCDVPAAATNIVAIAAGDYHSLALRTDGVVFAWGDDSAGQCDIPAAASNIVAISAGSWHNLALRADGSVIGWGDDTFGQIDAPAGLSNAVAIAAGGQHSLALRSDCTVWAWGSDLGPYGDYAGQSTVPSGLDQVIAVAAGGYHSLALRVDGTVVAWGEDTEGQTAVPAGLTNVLAVAAGEDYSLSLGPGGTVIGWGDVPGGESSFPFGLSGVTALAAGPDHCLMLRGTWRVGPRLLAPVYSGGLVSIPLPTARSRTYFLEYKDSLAEPHWTLLGGVAGDGTVKMLPDAAPQNPLRFYRVLQAF
jgi:O-glycosyl hydrolase